MRSPFRRVAYVLAGTGFGGAERIACTLAYCAAQSGLQTLVEAAPHTREGLAELELSTPAEEQELAEWCRAARQRVRDFRPDLVHVHLATPSMFVAGLRVAGDFSTLVTFHMLPEQGWPLDRLTGLPSRFHVFSNLWLRRRLSANVVGRTHFEHLSRFLPRSKFSWVENGIPMSLTPANDVAVWPGDGRRLLVVGRLVEAKGHLRLLRVLAHPNLMQYPWHLVVVGDGSAKGRFQAAAQELGLQERVSWVGAVPASRWYRAADLVLAPSLLESFGLVPLEAAAMGVPVVLSRIPGHMETFAEVPESFLSFQESEWVNDLEPLLSQPMRLQQLRGAQSGIGRRASTEALWARYKDLYSTLGA